MRKKIFICLMMFFVFPSFTWGATENLDEMMQRKSRYATASCGPDYLENSSTYEWQPESLCYTDVETGHEVWVLLHGPDQAIIYSKEYATEAWSYDGSIMGAFIQKSARNTNNTAIRMDAGYYARWLVKADGSQLKIATGYANEGIPEGGFGWAHTENAYYGVGAHASWDAPPGMLVKNVIDDNNVVTGSQLLDLNIGDSDRGWPNTRKGIIKRPISSDDNWISLSSRSAIDRGTTIDCYGHMRVALNKGVSPSIVDYWGVNRQIHEYFDHKQSSEYKAHGGGNWAFGFDHEYSHILYTAADHIFFQLKSSGTAADGGPKWENWNGSTYGNEEIMVMTYGNDSRGGDETPRYLHQYWNHPSIDKWEEYILTGLGDTTGIDDELLGPGIAVRKVLTGVGYDGGQGEIVNDLTTNPVQYDGRHKAWNGWTDSVIIFPKYIDDVFVGADMIHSRRLHFDTGEKDDVVAVAATHHVYDGYYPSYPRPSQSPDGTKVAFSTIWLNNGGDNYPYISYAVVEYPHPPEITQVTSSDICTIRFDWQLNQPRARGYSNRGWPTATDMKPWPRETKEFRLWRSTNGASGWIPVGTINANPQTKFDYSNGGLQNGQVAYWEITDAPGDGTWYYAVTAKEWSGLESHTLSNIYKITVSGGFGSGSQDIGYPANPGGNSNFYTTMPDEPIGVSFTYKESPATADGQYTIKWTRPADYTMIRYYNIYAEDGATPGIEQQNRIASIPAGAGPNGSFSWVDCLGNPNGTTQYAVTSVDYQGNESGVTSDGDNENPTVPSILTATAVSSTAIDLSWDASTDNVGVAGYRIYRDGNYLGVSSSVQYSDTGLTASTEYSYRVSAYDARGNESGQSSPASATTESEPSGDEEAPTVPGNLSATATSSTQIDLSWDASTDNLGVDGYRIYRDGNEVGTSSSTQYSDTGLTPSTTYTYGVSAYDAAVNESGQSSPASATTHESGSSETISVINAGDPWKYFKGGSDPGSGWNNVSFDYSSWLEGPTGIGYGDSDDATVLSDMRNNYLTVYARKIFHISDPSAANEMTMTIDYDDGFVAYINGHEVARSNISGTPSYDSPASGWNEAGTPVVFDLTVYRNILLPGTNVLAIEIHNAEIASSDLSMIPSLTVVVDWGPIPPSNASPTINSFTGVPSSLNNPGETITFNVSATDPDGDSLTYTIDFGDGTANGSGSQVVHTYEAEGIYTAEVTVDDGNGHTVGKSLQITVGDVRPAKPTGVTVTVN